MTEATADWWPDYLNYTKIRKDYFIHDTELLMDPTIRHNGRPWHNDRIIVPKARLLEIISQYHNLPSSGHCGVERTVGMFKRRYRFDYMRQRVRRYCRTCVPCQQAKTRHNRPRGLVEQLDITILHWQSISMDWTSLPTVKDETDKKFNQVLTVTDRGSNQVILIPCWWKDKNHSCG